MYNIYFQSILNSTKSKTIVKVNFELKIFQNVFNQELTDVCYFNHYPIDLEIKIISLSQICDLILKLTTKMNKSTINELIRNLDTCRSRMIGFT